MRNTAARWFAFLVFLAVPAWAGKKHDPNAKLCSVKTVFVSGNSKAAGIVRRELEKHTWLRLQNDKSKADAEFAVSEKRISVWTELSGPLIMVSGRITRRKELLWSDGVSGSSSVVSNRTEALVWMLLTDLDQEGGCRSVGQLDRQRRWRSEVIDLGSQGPLLAQSRIS
jgi:hypothetical protein